jgi:hypothetical protein
LYLRKKKILFRAAGGQIKRDYEYRLFEGGKYDDKGFLIKKFPIHAVVSISINFCLRAYSGIKLSYLRNGDCWFHIEPQPVFYPNPLSRRDKLRLR